jgi:protein-S-isoprenylcysteine O-methyltransferase Ste14
MAEPNDRGPGVWLPPPILFIVGFLIGWFIGRVWRPVPIVPDRIAHVFGAAGLIVAAVGVVIGAWGMLTFALAHTAIIPIHPAERLVQSGPYRFTRNPMYTGLTLLYLGLAVAVNALWPLLMLPIVLVALKRFVVDREEAYLSRKFGEAYDDYRRRVRRWI